MNGWAVSVLLVLFLGIIIEIQSRSIDSLTSRLDKAESLVDSYRRQADNTAKFDRIDKDLQHGGEGNLSDYLSGAAGKLWSAP